MDSKFTVFITFLTLLSHITFLFFVVLFFIEKKFKNWIYSFINKNVLYIVFATSLTAVLSSLFYSVVIGFPPCEFCWSQRIFIYPQVVISLLAIWKKDKSIIPYILLLSVIGGVIALYHSMAHWGIGTSLAECLAAGGDCGKLYVFEYGYITIPLMSLTIFVYIISISILYFKSLNDRV